MTVEIKVPAMGESVTEATISKWFKKEGDAVKRDEPLLELETDKVTVEVPSPADGAIESISAQAGATVAGRRPAGRHRRRQSRQPRRAAAKPKRRSPPQRPAAAAARPRGRRKPTRPPCPRPSAFPKKPASPLSSVAGTGKDGRVTKGDMLGALAARVQRAAAGRRRACPGPRHNEAREEKVADDAPAQDHRAAPEGIPEHRRPAHHLQRSGHDGGDGPARHLQGQRSRRSMA